MAELPNGISISEISFDELKRIKPRIVGWIYPRRGISRFIALFSTPQKAALNMWGCVSYLMIFAGVGLSFWFHNWIWLLLAPGALVVWSSNRRTMEQFFLENLQADEEFYNAVRSAAAETVKVVLRTP